jgi:hypothetical protein
MMKSGYSPLLDIEIKRVLSINYIFLIFLPFMCRGLLTILLLLNNILDGCDRRWTR